MRRPDSASGGGAGQRKPYQSRAARGGGGPSKQIDRDDARQKANAAGKHNKAQVMFAAETSQDPEHREPFTEERLTLKDDS
jgi:hypothetical protein